MVVAGNAQRKTIWDRAQIVGNCLRQKLRSDRESEINVARATTEAPAFVLFGGEKWTRALAGHSRMGGTRAFQLANNGVSLWAYCFIFFRSH